jgi:hypothetical protein
MQFVVKILRASVTGVAAPVNALIFGSHRASTRLEGAPLGAFPLVRRAVFVLHCVIACAVILSVPGLRWWLRP